ncbi:MAG: Zn-ribbon domain-containing OB-fold protein [Peptococcaceae bacterium]|jgi:uncharacterized OB-fold protein|nr:Zn-ribbon domain-containing OB-fold protein [Peptococcaceae bacterium]
MSLKAPPELIVFQQMADVPYNWSLGREGSLFLIALRDEKKFLGIKCPSCGKVYVPPRKVCGPCFTANSQWVEVGDEGVVTAFSVVNYRFTDPATGLPREVPYTFAFVRLDGADTKLCHKLAETDPARLKVGMRVKAVFAEQRTGNIEKDVIHFRAVQA